MNKRREVRLPGKKEEGAAWVQGRKLRACPSFPCFLQGVTGKVLSHELGVVAGVGVGEPGNRQGRDTKVSEEGRSGRVPGGPA